MPTPNLIRLNDGHKIPQLGFGVFRMTEDEAEAAVLAAFEAGYRHIDTAAIYRNEVGVGRAIAASGLRREEIFVTTKLWNKAQGRERARDGISRSLDKLGLDHVNLYLVHWPCPKQDKYVESWEALIDFRSEGLSTSIGVSNFLPEHLDRVVDETGITPAVNQIELHPTFQPREVIAHTQQLGIHIQTWSPLGASADLDHPEIVRIAEELEATPAQVIIAWHLNRGYIPIPKSVTPERIASNFASIKQSLTVEQLEIIDGLDVGNRVGEDPATVEPVW